MNNKFIAAWLLIFPCTSALAEESGAVSALVQTAEVRQMKMSSRVSGYGAVVPAPGAAVNLNFPKSGQVTRLLVAPGQQVARGSILLEITTDPAGTLAHEQAENAVAYAKGELARVKSLYSRQLATRSQVAIAAKSLKDAENALAALRAAGDGVQHDTLTAPFDGTIVAVAVAAGDRFAAGVNLAQIARGGFMEARLGIEPEDSRRVSAGMKVRLTSVFNPQDGAEGEIREVTGQIDPQTQLVNVLVRLEGSAFLPGTRVRGDIAIATHDAQAVPRQAVLRDDAGAYLFQVANGAAHRVTITTGVEEEGWIEVMSPALPRMPVVTLGNYELTDNMAVRESAP